MSSAVQLGPLLLPVSLLVLFGSVAAALIVGRRLAAPAGADLERVLWQTLLVGLVVARLGFVLRFRSAYLASPLDILDIRDGGWSPTAGLVGAWLFALARQRRWPALARPLRAALLTGTVLFVAGTTALSLRPDSRATLPALSLTSLDGSAVRLDGFVGKPTVLNLWATWCPPCVREMPVLHRAQLERPDVNFVFVNQGEPAGRVRAWLAARGLSLTHVLVDEKGQASAALDQQGYPTTLFYDASGRLDSIRVGELSAATLRQRLAGISR